MANVVVSASGTWGDVLPMLALALGLKDCGHTVRFAVNETHHRLAKQVGLQPWPCGPAFGPAEAQRAVSSGQGSLLTGMNERKTESRIAGTPAQHRDLLKACREADLLISPSFQLAPRLVRDQLGLPWVCVSLVPAQYEHCGFPACLEPAPRATLNLLASSEHFRLPNLILHDDLELTGFLFLDGRRLRNWQPERELRAFVERPGRVLVLSLGCLAGSLALRTAKAAARAAGALRRRLVIQPGWSNLSPRALGNAMDPHWIRFAGPLSHDWLLRHAETVIHGGGTGMCARSLRAGAPMVLLPQRMDQVFNARIVLALGAGAVFSPGELTGTSLAQTIREKVWNRSCRDAVRSISVALRIEDGVRSACGALERLLARRSCVAAGSGKRSPRRRRGAGALVPPQATAATQARLEARSMGRRAIPSQSTASTPLISPSPRHSPHMKNPNALSSVPFTILEPEKCTCMTRWYDRVLSALRARPEFTSNSSEAVFAVPGFDSACETNWPHYGNPGKAFLAGDRSYFEGQMLDDLAELASLWTAQARRLLVLNMSPFSGLPEAVWANTSISLASASVGVDEYRPGIDISFPASPIVTFPGVKVRDHPRTLLASFVGADTSPVRQELTAHADVPDLHVKLLTRRPHFGHVSTRTSFKQRYVRDFSTSLLRSRFGLVPRGDALFSYRLLETMAAGAVPVILSDGWVLPFSEILDWEQFSITCPESEVSDLFPRLRAVPDAEFSRLQARSLETYETCFSSLEAQIDTLLRIVGTRGPA